MIVDGENAIPNGNTIAALPPMCNLPLPLALAIVEVVDALVNLRLQAIRLKVVLRLVAQQLFNAKAKHLLDGAVGVLNGVLGAGDQNAVLAGLHRHEEGAGGAQAALYGQLVLAHLKQLVDGG